MRITLLLPTLNEAEGLPRTLARLPRERLRAMGHRLEVMIVDGSSTDGTPQVAQRLGVRVVDEPRRGYGRAYKTGLASAEGELVVTADADDTYPLDLLPDLLERFVAGGCDFATVNRLAALERRSMSATNRFGNWVLTTTARLLYGVTLRDSQSGMWILSTRALARLPIADLSDGMAFSQEIKLHAFRDPELRAVELPGRYYVRTGEVKLSRWQDGFGNLMRLVRGRLSMRTPRQASR